MNSSISGSHLQPFATYSTQALRKAISPDERLVEMVELPRDVHPWYVATQAHPEFKSRPTNPQPLFREFVRASIGQHEGVDRLQVTPMNLATD